jgi:radical SAM superfamily enzyme YgiQ (UPF0313 family)
MKVLLVYPDFCIGSGGKFYEGIAIISSVLKQAGHKVNFVHLDKEEPFEYILQEIKSFSPGLIGFSATTNMFAAVANYAAAIKEKFEIPVICGGIHPTLCPQDSLLCSGIDMICRGEGEYTLLELCNNLEKNKNTINIQNIWVKNSDGSITQNPLRPLVDNLDSLPYPDRDIFKQNKLIASENARVTILASRGCPYDCSYCCNHALRGLYAANGRYIRYKSVNYILKEIALCLEKNPQAEYLYFYDDILTLDKKWFRELAYSCKEKYGLPYMCNSRFNLINEDIVRIFKETGCIQLSFGLESGNDYIRNNILNRQISKENIIKAAKLCRDAAIPLYTYNMIGLPDEGMKEILDSVKLNAEIEADEVQLSIFYPYRGTQTYERCLKENCLKDKNLNSYFEDSVIKLKNISQKNLQFAYRNFKNFVRHYRKVNKMRGFLSFFVAKALDVLWYNQNIYESLMRAKLLFKRGK